MTDDGVLLLTGFGPFGQHAINPSWEVARTMHGTTIGSLTCRAYPLPVVYETTSELVPKLWRQVPNVRLCVHCGVGLRGGFYLEQRGRNGPYSRLDITGRESAGLVCLPEHAETLFTQVPVAEVIKRVQETYPDLQLRASDDAGLYLCEFSLYLSLAVGTAPAVFLHVPPVGEPYSHEEMCVYVREILTHVVEMTLPLAALTATPSPQVPALAATPKRPVVGVGVFVTNPKYPGMILVGKRLKAGFGCQTFALPGGHLEFGESFEDCGVREVMEECGLVLSNTRPLSTVNSINSEADYHTITIFVTGEAHAEPRNLEPEKCAGWEWVQFPDGIPSPMFLPLEKYLQTSDSPFE
eukprot:m.710904 g.710904  ORF g.710904 m.710904 type:complete len:353 (-) comp58766_c0_seq6:886-1944(-)